jgi:hypothetical protein
MSKTSKWANNRPKFKKGQQWAKADNKPNLKKGKQRARANNEPNFKMAY